MLIFFVAGGYLFSQYTSTPKTIRDYLGKPEYMTIDLDKPLGTQTSIVEIGERTFEIPAVYIQTNLGGKRKQDGVNLLYVYPDFTSRADFENKQEYEKANNEKRFGHMLIHIPVEDFTLGQSFEAVRASVNEIEEKELFNSLKREIWYRTKKGEIKPYYDVYVYKNSDGQVVDYINCSPEEKEGVKHLGCSHKFVDKNILYSIYYNKEKFLSSWREHKEKAIAFIDSFEIKTSQ